MSVQKCPLSSNLGFMNYLEANKVRFKIRQSKIALKETLTIKLGVTLVLTVTQVVRTLPTVSMHADVSIEWKFWAMNILMS